MASTERQKQITNEWQRKNYKRLGVKLYKGDAEAFEEYCRENNTSVNAALREYVAQCIGRPLEKRGENAEAAAGEEDE